MSETLNTTEAPPNPSPAAPSAPVPEAPPPEEEVIAGDRLGMPTGAARTIADPSVPAPSYLFLFVVSVVSFVSDIGSKLWAEKRLDQFATVEVVEGYLTLILAKNRGGAWGLLQGTSENVRRPFFLLVSVVAILFIVTLYRRLMPRQRALKWGLPLVLGGALGNVFDRIRYGYVIDFIDVHMVYGGQEHHWPTFNVADVAICVGVGLMAVDMFTSKKPKRVTLATVEPELVKKKSEAEAVASPEPPKSEDAGPGASV